MATFSASLVAIAKEPLNSFLTVYENSATTSLPIKVRHKRLAEVLMTGETALLRFSKSIDGGLPIATLRSFTHFCCSAMHLFVKTSKLVCIRT